MARRTIIQELPSEENQDKRLEYALKLLNTPVGRALLRDGVTLRRWSGSNPANYWVESKTGRMLFHSDRDDPRCPVISAYGTLRPFLELTTAQGGSEQVGHLGPELVAEYKRRKLVRVAKRAGTASRHPRKPEAVLDVLLDMRVTDGLVVSSWLLHLSNEKLDLDWAEGLRWLGTRMDPALLTEQVTHAWDKLLDRTALSLHSEGLLAGPMPRNCARPARRSRPMLKRPCGTIRPGNVYFWVSWPLNGPEILPTGRGRACRAEGEGQANCYNGVNLHSGNPPMSPTLIVQ